MQKQERLDELMLELEKKTKLLQVVNEPLLRISKQWKKYYKLQKEVEALGEMVNDAFYEGEE